MDKKTGILVVFLIITIISLALYLYVTGRVFHKLNVYFFDAGKADAALITFEGQHILIDTGEEDFYDKLDLYLKSNNIKKIDHLIITHFDKDHVGSASKIIDNYIIGKVYQTNTKKESDYYNNYIESLKKKNIEPITVSGDMKVSIGQLHMTINGPDKVYEEDESNNSSLITSIYYKDKSFLFMGDAMNERIEDYLFDHHDRYDVIKWPYHGYYLKNDKKLYDEVKPKNIIISSNVYDDKLMDYLESKWTKIYKTGDGPVSISTNGMFLKFDKLK